jgi:Rrf2 family protein
MHFSAQEEYGLRCLLRLAAAARDQSVTIPEISQAEGMSIPYTAKMMRILRDGGLVTSERGQGGGYRLARLAKDVTVQQALEVLGGPFFEGEFCEKHSGVEDRCTHSIDCSIRSLWRAMQQIVDGLLSKTTLQDLVCGERDMDVFVNNLVVLTSAADTGGGARLG